MRLSVAIQTHPARAELAAQLAAQLPGAEVIVDPDPDSTLRSPWRTYRAALEATPADATHRLILQEDAQVCAGFLSAARAAVAARPHRPITFFHAGEPSENLLNLDAAYDRGDAWATLEPNRWIPTVALSWPVQLIRPALEFVDAQSYPPSFVADDELVGRALRHVHEYALVTIPSLVEHPDLVPSLVGRRAWGGIDKGRVAHRYIGAGDPARINWQQGPW